MTRIGTLFRAALVCSVLLLRPPMNAAEPEPGFRNLFNGKDLTGWDGDPRYWSVKDGVITGQTTAANPLKDGNTFLIWREGELEDFQLRFQFKITANNDKGFANSGVQYRSRDLGNWVVGGYQADFEAGKTYSGILYEERGRGILAERGQRTTITPQTPADEKAPKHAVKVTGSLGASADIQAAIRSNDWNEYVIIAQGSHLVHVINGMPTVDVTDNDGANRAAAGLLALQLHAGEAMTVQFKDIRVKRLKQGGQRRLVLVAGRPSHAPGDHEFNAGVKLMKRCLQGVIGLQIATYHNGWPSDPSAFDEADAILFYMDGGRGHPIIQGDHLEILGELMKKGVGLACAHFAVEVPAGKPGDALLDWIGGFYEDKVSTNPHWIADIKNLPKHPITRGVDPFGLNDEWYFNIHFRPGMKGVTPILTATPSDEARQGRTSSPRGPHKHIVDAKGRAEVLAWAVERPDGGRGFGFTGGHHHENWGNDNFRKLFLNALLWITKVEPPPGGFMSIVSELDLKANLDPKGEAAKPAANVNGTWNFQVETAAGAGTPTFVLKQEGEKLTGTYSGQLGEAPLTGTIKGNDVKWTFQVRLSEQDVTVTYTGKVEGPGAMKGKAQLGEFGEGTWTAKK